MHVTAKTVDRVQVVMIGETRLDTEMATEFKKYVVELVTSGPPNLLLNLNEVSMIDSQALGIVALIYKFTKKDGEFALCHVQNNVKTLLRMTKLDQIFLCYDTEEEAIAALTNQTATESFEEKLTATTAEA